MRGAQVFQTTFVRPAVAPDGKMSAKKGRRCRLQEIRALLFVPDAQVEGQTVGRAPRVLQEQRVVPVPIVRRDLSLGRHAVERDAVDVERTRVGAVVQVADMPRVGVRPEAAAVDLELVARLQVVAAAECGRVVVRGRRHLRLPAAEGERRGAVDAREPARPAQAAGRSVEPRRELRRVHLRDHRPAETEVLERRRGEGAVAPDALPLGLVRPAPAFLGQHRVGPDVGRQPPLRLLLQAPVGVADEAVPPASLHGDLAPELVEIAEIGRDGAIDARHRLVDAKVVVEAVEPGAVAGDRAPEVGVGLEEEQVRVAGVAARRQRVVDVLADEALMLVVAVEHPAPVVAAALHGHHDERPGRGHLHVGTGRGRRELADRVVVEVEAGAPLALRRVDSVGQHPILVADAEAFVSGLLALVRPADVEAAHPDPGRLAQHRPHVGGGRHVLQLLHAKVVHERGGLQIDHRCVARDGDRLGHRRQLQRRVDANGAAALDDHPFAHECPEPGDRERQVVRPAPECAEEVRAVDQGHRRLRPDQRFSFQRDRHARHGEPLRIRYRAADLSNRLGDCRRREHERQKQSDSRSLFDSLPNSPHQVPSFTNRRTLVSSPWNKVVGGLTPVKGSVNLKVSHGV